MTTAGMPADVEEPPMQEQGWLTQLATRAAAVGCTVLWSVNRFIRPPTPAAPAAVSLLSHGPVLGVKRSLSL